MPPTVGNERQRWCSSELSSPLNGGDVGHLFALLEGVDLVAEGGFQGRGKQIPRAMHAYGVHWLIAFTARSVGVRLSAISTWCLGS